MLLIFIILIVLFQISGDVILQINKLYFNKDIDKYTLLEHFLFGLVIGLLINTIFTITEVFLIPFNLFILIIINFFWIFVGFLLNKKSFNNFFYTRLIKCILGHEKLIETKKYYIKFLIFIIFLIIIDLYLSIIIQTEHIQLDLLVYAHHSLDSIRNGWNYYDPTYLAKRIYYTNFFSFLIIPFYSIDPINWITLTNIYLYRLQFYIFFSLVFSFSYRLNSRLFYLPLILYLSTFHFLTWFSYVLPVNFNLIFALVLIFFIYEENCKSNFISIFILLFMFLNHATSLIIIFFFPLILTLVIKFMKNPHSFYLYNKLNYLKNKFLKISKIFRFFIIFFFGLIIILLIIIFFHSFNYYFNVYMSMGRQDYNPLPFFDLWNNFTLGFPIIILICFGITIGLIYNKRRINHISKILFFYFLGVYLIVILSNFEFWRHIIRSPYLEYRFIVYLDFCLFFLIPIFLFNLKNLEHINISKFKKRYYHFKKLVFGNIGSLLFTILLFSLCFTKIFNNYTTNYNFPYFSKFWPTGYQKATEFVNNNKFSNSTYMFNPEGKIFTANWEFFHTYLGDTRCIDLRDVVKFYNDSIYSYDNPNYTSNYENFTNFIFNKTKNIYPYIANYKNLPNTLRFTKEINFIFIDDASNKNLITLMFSDTKFNLLFNESMYWYRMKADVHILIFEPVGY